ncbi:hypothetical protein Droror1_Dr00005494 [Drosera rotundifolia]
MNPPQTFTLFLSLLLVVAASATTTTTTNFDHRRELGHIVGGFSVIKDLTDPHLVEIARFAVSEYNRLQNGILEFEDIKEGEFQIVNGINYRLTISAKDQTAVVGNYEALVHERAWVKYRSLTSFRRKN